MTDAAQGRRNRRLGPLLAGLGLAPVAGAAAFFAVQSGLLPLPAPPAAPLAEAAAEIVFVPIEPLVIALGREARGRHLRFAAMLEAPRREAAAVAGMMPRIVDALNGYLRAVDLRDIEDPSAMMRLRAQMLRRVLMVAGEGRVRDLLITEFVVN